MTEVKNFGQITDKTIEEAMDTITDPNALSNIEKFIQNLKNKNKTRKRVGFTKQSLSKRAAQYKIDRKRQKQARKDLRKSFKLKGRKVQ